MEQVISCSSCWYHRTRLLLQPICVHPSSYEYTDNISGEKKYKMCYHMRYEECGYEGKLYRPWWKIWNK